MTPPTPQNDPRRGGDRSSDAPSPGGADLNTLADAGRPHAPSVGENSRQGRKRLVIGQTTEEHAGEKYRPIDWHVTRRLLRYMLRYPKLQGAIVLYAVLLALVTTSVPYVATLTIRYTLDQPELWRDLFPQRPLWHAAVLGGILIAALAAAYYAVMGVRLVAVNRLAERVIFDLRHDIFTHVQRLDVAFFDRTKLGRILSRGTSDINAVRQAVAQIIPRTLIHSLEIAITFVAMFTFDWVLAALVLALGPVLYFLNAVFRKRMGEAYRRVQESFSRITANIAETVSGVRVTQAFAREQENARMFEGLLEDHRQHNMFAARQHGLYIPLFDLASQTTAVIVIAAGAWRVSSGAMSVSDLVGFLFFSGLFFGSIIVIAELYNTTLQAMAGGERIFALLDTKPTVVDHDQPQDLPARPARSRDDSATPEPTTDDAGSLGARIDFQNVSFAYSKDAQVLRGVSFTAEPGRTVALVGHTGAGKTTIVNLLARFYDRTAGEIFIDGVPIERIRLASLQSQIGLVLQDNILFAGSVMDNIRFGRPDASDDEVRAAADSLGCLDIFEALPEGLFTDVGERGTGLSLGQRQLICFCRAMIAEPRILILDEATSAVDTHTEHTVQTALERLMQGRTNIVVAHRLSTIRSADLILVLDHGEIVERGSHDQLIARSGRYRELYDQFVRLSAHAE